MRSWYANEMRGIEIVVVGAGASDFVGGEKSGSLGFARDDTRGELPVVKDASAPQDGEINSPLQMRDDSFLQGLKPERERLVMSDLKVRPPKDKRARGPRGGEKQVPRLRSGRQFWEVSRK